MLTHPADVRKHPEWDVERYTRFRELIDRAAPLALAGVDDVAGAAAAIAVQATPTPSQLVTEVAGGRSWLGLADGRTFSLVLSPGTCAVSTHDQVRSDRAVDRLRSARAATVAQSVGYLLAGDEVPEPVVSRSITEWSAKSRARMFRTIPSLDFSEWGTELGTLCMVTLTLPGCWELLAPTGRQWKRLIDALRKRWIRAIGEGSWLGLWKLEFQRRGAPHQHMLMRVPVMVAGVPFPQWLSRTWASVVLDSLDAGGQLTYVASGDYDRHLAAGTAVDWSGQKFSDPRRIATYFLGHSAKHVDGKEYQNTVPQLWQAGGAGPGRFWGYWGLEMGTVEVELTAADFFAVRRVLRKVAGARAWTMRQIAATYGKSDAQLVQVQPLRSYAGACGRPDCAEASWVGHWGPCGDASCRELGPHEHAAAHTHRRRRPVRRLRAVRSLGARGGLAGGTVVVNDGVALGYDLARFLAGGSASSPAAAVGVRTGGRWTWRNGARVPLSVP